MRGSPGGLALIKKLVAAESWDFSDKVRQFLNQGEYALEDLESCVLTGSVRKREKDDDGEAVDGNKYTIVGRGVSGLPFYVVGKILRGEESHYFFFITARVRRV